MVRTPSGNGWLTQEFTTISEVFKAYDAQGNLISNQTHSQGVPSFKGWKQSPVSGGRVSVGGSKFRKPTTWSAWSIEYNYQRETRKVGPMWWWYNQTYVNEGAYNAGYNPNDWTLAPPGARDASLDSAAIISALNRLNSEKANIGQFLAEARESAGQLLNTALLFAQLLSNARRGSMRLQSNPLLLAKMLNDQALAAKFGYAPLINDLYSQYKLIKEGMNMGLLVHSKGRSQSSNSGSTTAYNNGCLTEWTYVGRSEAAFYAQLSGSFLAGMNQIGLMNPALVAWELVPLSFVWDWFMPIGSFIQSLSATAGLSFVGGYLAQRDTIQTKVRMASCGYGVCKYNSFSRVGYNSWPSAFTDYTPYAKSNPLNLDQGKVETLLRLIAQRGLSPLRY